MRYRRNLGVAVALAALGPGLALAQFPSEIVSFEDLPSGQPSNEEMFHVPEFSGTTRGYLVLNTPGNYEWNSAFRNPSATFATDGIQALEVRWKWVNQHDVDAWTRLTTNNHPVRPNPALDTRGKVRFDITNFGDLSGGEVGVCIGIRETGVDVAQLANGGATGTIEWVGVDDTVNAIIAGADGVASTVAAGDDVQLITVGTTELSREDVVIAPGPNGVVDSTPAGDDVARYGYFTTNGAPVPIPVVTLPPALTAYRLEFNLATGDVTVQEDPTGIFGPPGPVINHPGAIAPFTGNGVLDPPNFRGVLEHIAFTNVTTDPPNPTPTAPDVVFGLDRLQFEATVPDPVSPPSVVAPVFAGDTSVQVQATPGATLTELFKNDVSIGTAVPNVDGLSTHVGLAPMQAGDVLRATQTKDGLTSEQSLPVLVFAVGVLMADNFDTYSNDADLRQFWTDSVQSPTPPTAKVMLQAGGAASCPNFLREQNPAGSNAARLYRALGSVNGTDAEPLWVTWNFQPSGTEGGAGMRTRFELAHFNGGGFSTGVRGDGTVGITLNNTVAGALFSDYNLTVRSTDPEYIEELTTNGWTNAGGFLRVASGVPKTMGVWRKMQIEIRSSVINFYIDGVNVNPTPYEAGIPRPNNTAYTHLIIGEGFSNNGPTMMFDNVSVTQGPGGTLHPFGDPVTASPTVVGPIYPQATAVTVDDIDTSGASIVRVYAGNTQIGSAGGPFANPSIVINVPSLANGTAVSATQTVAGEESCKSVPVIVGVPAPTIGDDLLVPTQNTVTVTDVVVGQATRVDVYVSESTLIGSVTTTGFASDTVVVPVAPALGNGQSITASQTIGGVEGLLSAAVVVAVPAPSVPNVLALGDNAVLVQDLHPLASTATVYINDSPAGSAPTGGATSVSVPIGASLTPGDRVAATQTIGGVEGPESEELTVQAGYCNVVFESDMDSPAGWTAFVPAADAAATFGFDYSTMGIPPSPFGGGTTRALKFEVNKSSATRQTVAVQPTGLNMTGRFQVRFDFWINANGPFPGGGTGSTEMLGGGVGFTGVQPVATSAGPGSSGGYLVISGEGGASRDWRLYKNTGEQFIESGQYDIDTNEVVGNPPTGSQDLAAHFPAVSPPPFQQANYPQQTGQTFPGAGGFAWHTMVITVDTDNARANFTVDGLSIGTINGNIGAAVNLSGGLQLLYSDIFTSVSDNADLSFGLVDNFVVLTDLPNPGTNGDWDNDGDVNLEDFIRFADCLSGPGELADPRTGPGCRVVCEQVFDRDADGDIDLYDFARFAQLLP